MSTQLVSNLISLRQVHNSKDGSKLEASSPQASAPRAAASPVVAPSAVAKVKAKAVVSDVVSVAPKAVATKAVAKNRFRANFEAARKAAEAALADESVPSALADVSSVLVAVPSHDPSAPAAASSAVVSSEAAYKSWSEMKKMPRAFKKWRMVGKSVAEASGFYDYNDHFYPQHKEHNVAIIQGHFWDFLSQLAFDPEAMQCAACQAVMRLKPIVVPRGLRLPWMLEGDPDPDEQVDGQVPGDQVDDPSVPGDHVQDPSVPSASDAAAPHTGPVAQESASTPNESAEVTQVGPGAVQESEAGEDEQVSGALARILPELRCEYFKRERRGRVWNTKGDHDGQQTLSTWMEQCRAGQYRVLLPEEFDSYFEEGHQPPPFPYVCFACNCAVCGHTKSSNLHILLHESSKRHLRCSGAMPLANPVSMYCDGILLSQEAASKSTLGRLRLDIIRWCENSRPEHLDTKVSKNFHIEQRRDDIHVRTEKCKSFGKYPKDPRALACSSCIAMLSNSSVSSHISKMLRNIDLVQLLHLHVFGETTAERAEHIRHMRASAYFEHAQVTVDEISGSFDELLDLVKRRVANVGKHERNSGLQILLLKLNVLQPGLLKRLKSLDAVNIKDLAANLVAGRISQTELDVASKIRSGVLKNNDVCRALVVALVSKADRIGKGQTRVTSSSIPDFDQARLQEIAFRLTMYLDKSQLLRELGLNIKCKIAFNHQYLPRFFLPGDAEIVENLQLVADLCNSIDRRAWMFLGFCFNSNSHFCFNSNSNIKSNSNSHFCFNSNINIFVLTATATSTATTTAIFVLTTTVPTAIFVLTATATPTATTCNNDIQQQPASVTSAQHFSQG